MKQTTRRPAGCSLLFLEEFGRLKLKFSHVIRCFKVSLFLLSKYRRCKSIDHGIFQILKEFKVSWSKGLSSQMKAIFQALT
jgi:hypothetical protein